MKIAFVTPEFLTRGKLHDGGLASYIYKISRSLQQLGHLPVIIMSGSEDKRLEFEGIPVVMVKTGTHGIHHLLNRITLGRLRRAWEWIFQSVDLNKALRKLHKSEPFDVIQFSSYKFVGLFAPSFITSTIRISSLQFLYETSIQGKLSLSTKMLIFFEELTLKRSSFIYGPGKYLANHVSVNVLNHRPVSLLPTPALMHTEAEDDTPYKQHQQTSGHRPYALYFGTISELKGAYVLEKLIPALFNAAKEWDVVLIGKCSSQEADSPLNRIKQAIPASESTRLFHYDSMSHAQLTPFIKNAAFTLITSKYDNFPNTALEAMQQGKIIFASNRASLETLIRHEENGYMCDFNNADDYLSKILAYRALTLEQKQRMSELARKAVEAHSPEKSAAALISYFEHIMQVSKGIKKSS